MKELYWIERLDSLQGFFMSLLFISMMCLFFLFLIPFSNEYSKEECKKRGIYIKRMISIIIMISSMVILVFIPSSSEAYRIMGIGGTIDYIRENETARKIPDKCIKALDLFMDKIIEEDNTNK